MRIVVVSGIAPPDIGGPASHVADVVGALRGRGHDVVVVTLGDNGRTEREAGLVRFPRRWPWPVRLAAVVSEVVRTPAEVVYAAGMHEAAALAARLTGRPLVVRVPGDHAWERASRLGLTALGFDAFQRARGGPWRVRAMRAARTWAVQQAAVAVVPSTYLAGAVRTWAPGVPVEVVPIGVAAPPPPERPPPQAGRLQVVWVGRLVAVKRLEVLVEAVGATAGAELVVVGDGPERGRLAALARARGARVRFLGALPREQVWCELAAADVLALASAHEGLPHVAVEALAVGTPVVAPDTAWAREVVEDGECGVLVAEPSAAAFAEVFARLRDDLEWRAALAKHAAARVGAWTLQASVDRIEAILEGARRRSRAAEAASTARPRAVFVGKGGFEPPASLPAKFAIFARSLDATVVSVRPRGGLPAVPVRTVAFPRGPKLAASVLFYALGPVVAVGLAAARRGSVVVCQSPFEGAGVVALARLVPRRRRPRVMIELHGDWRVASRLYGSRWRRLFATPADRVAVAALRRADRVRAVSSFLERLAREVGYAGEIDRFVAFSDFREFLDPPVCPLPTEPVAVFAGVLEAPKAPEVLLDAWRLVQERLPAARLVLAGTGPMEAALRAQARELDIEDTVAFAGQLSRPELRRRMDAATCLVLPSRNEGLGRVVLEAMARGRPVVATAAGGIPDLVEDGACGRLVPMDDPPALAEALVEVLGDATVAARMGAEARRRAEARDPAREFEEGIGRLAVWAGGHG